MRVNPTTRLCVLVALTSGACSSSTKKHQMTMQEMIAADPLPLARGAKWTYDVTVRRFDADADKEVSKSLTWTTEVVDVKPGNGVTAYRVKGWPSDLESAARGAGSATAGHAPDSCHPGAGAII